MWDECQVEMDGCVVRELKRKLDRDGSGGQDDYKHWVFATTRCCLTDSNMIKIYELRPEIEEDHRQWKHGLWDIAIASSSPLPVWFRSSTMSYVFFCKAKAICVRYTPTLAQDKSSPTRHCASCGDSKPGITMYQWWCMQELTSPFLTPNI